MKERPILFNAEMVKAILCGRKTQTRRLVKFPIIDVNMGCELAGNELAGEVKAGDYRNFPLGQPGDQLWVRETWGVVSHAFDDDGVMIDWVPDRPATPIHELPFGNGYYSGHSIYAADGIFTWGDDDGYEDGRSCWKPSIHMPRLASRINLLITSVRVERLNSMTNADAKAEGYPAEREIDGGSTDPWLWFRDLWDGIYPDNTFKANPWVWVIEFERVGGDL
ncbi:hypothetical protein QNM34_07795 [Rahnella bonaserana]|uniref:hypothetical protein n=1 Tax=Rahnella bonaserana TaxID=2816248 RepID=UPI0024C3C2B2|nr:hypothetical protein [Rahnella bonaserana]WHZ42168.1 hypothetical protein QNM34_07795 [Rahnella bonaserana]